MPHQFERPLQNESLVVLEARRKRIRVLLQHKVAQFGGLERHQSRGSPLGFVQVAIVTHARARLRAYERARACVRHESMPTRVGESGD